MIDWKEKTVAHWDMINRLARRRFGDRPLAEEAALAVMDGLLANDGRRVRAFQGKSSFQTFLATLSGRLLEDFARIRFGRVRPPLWIRSLGTVWVQLFRFLCLERLPLAEAVEQVSQQQHAESYQSIEQAAWTIRAEVVECGKQQGVEVALTEENELGGTDSENCTNQAQELEEEQRRQLFQSLFRLILGEERVPEENALVTLAQCTIRLKPEERLLLKLCFQDGLSVAGAGKMLGYNRYQAHGRLRRLLARLRAEFTEAGLAPELVTLLTP